MKIDKNEFIKNNGKMFRIAKITDKDKFSYWENKSSQYSTAIEKAKPRSPEYIENLRNCILCELEKNKYCQITHKSWTLLYLVLRHHNSLNPKNKIYMNNKGLLVKNK